MNALCLHGYRQDRDKFRSRMKSLLKDYRIICPQGPHPVEKDMTGWWSLQSKEMFVQPHSYVGVEKALESIPEGNYDVVVGFSQGAVAAAIAIDQKRVTTTKLVLISPSDIVDTVWTPSQHDVTTLILIGAEDTLCPPTESLKMQQYFPNSVVHQYSCGHVIPNCKKELKAFLSK